MNGKQIMAAGLVLRFLFNILNQPTQQKPVLAALVIRGLIVLYLITRSPRHVSLASGLAMVDYLNS